MYHALAQFYFLHLRSALERFLVYANLIVLVKSIVRVEQPSRLQQTNESLLVSSDCQTRPGTSDKLIDPVQ